VGDRLRAAGARLPRVGRHDRPGGHRFRRTGGTQRGERRLVAITVAATLAPTAVASTLVIT
jgi:hypothetical protein